MKGAIQTEILVRHQFSFGCPFLIRCRAFFSAEWQKEIFASGNSLKSVSDSQSVFCRIHKYDLVNLWNRRGIKTARIKLVTFHFTLDIDDDPSIVLKYDESAILPPDGFPLPDHHSRHNCQHIGITVNKSQ